MPPKQQNLSRSLWRLIFAISAVILALSTLITIISRAIIVHRQPFSRLIPRRAMSSPSYAHELHVALLAVQRAAILTREVYNTTAKGTVEKSDHSPVTIGDFGAQALIISALRHNFPQDEIVAEEDADDLRGNEELREKVWQHVRQTSLNNETAEEALAEPLNAMDHMLSAIDGGRSSGGRHGRVWTIDPIDGTKGFLRGGQYAIALALIIDGDVKVGVLGCPNLPVDDTVRLDSSIGHDQEGDKDKGVLMSAVISQGAQSRALTRGALAEGTSIKMREVTDIKEATFCESVEAAHSSHGDQAEITKILGITQQSVRMDSQAKYASIARGAGDIYLRLPTSKAYQEKIWDHAAGELIVREAGGQVTDIKGNRVDFGTGRTLTNNKGFVAASTAIHAEVLAAVQQVMNSKL